MKTRRRVLITYQPPVLPDPGARVGVVCGPGEFPRDCQGIVLCHVAQEWMPGEVRGYALVLMDSGQIKECSGLNRGPGIGWHLVG